MGETRRDTHSANACFTFFIASMEAAIECVFVGSLGSRSAKILMKNEGLSGRTYLLRNHFFLLLCVSLDLFSLGTG